MVDIETSYTLEKSIIAYKAMVRWFGTSKCGKYMATLGYLVSGTNNNFVDVLKIWDLQRCEKNPRAPSLELLYEKVFEQEVYCLRWYQLAGRTKSCPNVACLAVCMEDRL